MDDSTLPITRSEFKAKVQAHQAKLKLDFETARQALANSPSGPIDEDGYPTQEALNVVSTWHDPEYSRESLKLLFEFMYSLWHLKSWGWSESIVNHEFREGIRVLQFNGLVS